MDLEYIMLFVCFFVAVLGCGFCGLLFLGVCLFVWFFFRFLCLSFIYEITINNISPNLFWIICTNETNEYDKEDAIIRDPCLPIAPNVGSTRRKTQPTSTTHLVKCM